MAADTSMRGSTLTVESPTFGKDGSFHVDEAVGSASISPSGRDVVLASRQGLHIIDLDSPYSPPRHLPHRTPWEVADVQWSPFTARDYWVVSTSNQKALVWNLDLQTTQAPIQHVLHAHSRAITDINFSAHDPDMLATCAVDSFIHCWDLRHPAKPAITFADWFSGATQVKWNRQDSYIIASSHDRLLHIWDSRKSAQPLRTIEAHATKIYGIDWNRVEASNILTCSLDRTIKLWDYTLPELTPKRVIKTPYPIWRARHTPFGYGILVMPQKGNNDLHLYDRRDDEVVKDDDNNGSSVTPVHSFAGHQHQVKEFLWRYQGTIEDGKDQRSFQLVSWSSDKTLLLHRVDEALLNRVGHEKGATADSRLNLTRKDAVYRSFRDENFSLKFQQHSTGPPAQGLSSIFRDASRSGMRKIGIPNLPLNNPRDSPVKVEGMRLRNSAKKEANPITWMKGVKISRARNQSMSGRAQRLTSSTSLEFDGPDSLGDEVVAVGDKYKNLAFERIDIPARIISFTLNGPWGVEDNLVHIKCDVHFPKDYPDRCPPRFDVERTSSIPDATFIRLSHGIKTICEGYTSVGRGCFEAAVGYLLGERNLNETISWLSEAQDAMIASVTRQADESSSDDEDVTMGGYNGFHAQDLDASHTDIVTAVNANANVPLPKACGALWAEDGRLVCFFPPKEDTVSFLNIINYDDKEVISESNNGFESFGRLQVRPPNLGHRRRSSSDNSNSDSSEHSSSNSSTSSSSFDSLGEPTNLFARPRMWRLYSQQSRPKSLARSQPSSARTILKHRTGNPKTFISIHNFDELLPAKRALAEEYVILGDPESVFTHNTEVATKHGYQDIADVWELARLLTFNEVPLDAILDNISNENIVVLAKRVLVHIKRKDSGLDLSFDEPDSVVNPKLKGRVKWGEHPLAASWLIKNLFDHFERLGDVQMLAMLSCVFWENSNREESFKPTMGLLPPDSAPGITTMSSLTEYCPNEEIGRSQRTRSTTAKEDKSISRIPLDGFASLSLSNEPWGPELGENEKSSALSAESTPPYVTRQNTRTSNVPNSLSSSPEGHIRRSNSNVGNTFASSLSKPFSFLASSSPPSQTRIQAELSTSAPSSASVGTLSWARSKSRNDTTNSSKSESKSGGLYMPNESDTDEDVALLEDQEEISIVLKNQNAFDDEAQLNTPLLPPHQVEKYHLYRTAYADLLYVWGLPLSRCEVLKFNGLNFSTSLQSQIQRSSTFELGEKSTFAQEEDVLSEDLTLAMYCTACSTLIPQMLPFGTPAHCPNCQKIQRNPRCSVCDEIITGLSKFCVSCGHNAHSRCLEIWLAENSFGAIAECESGCGCLCGNTFSMDLEFDSSSTGKDDLRNIADQSSNGLGAWGWNGSAHGIESPTTLRRLYPWT